MKSKIAELLACRKMPVALLCSDEKPDEAIMFKEGTRGCIIALLNLAAQGKIAALSELTTGCNGGRVGAGFTSFKRGFIEYFLSVGSSERGEGEHYKESPELALAYMDGLPKVEAREYLIIKPYELLSADEKPAAVVFLVNADELSALVTLANYDKSSQDNVEIKFGSGCAQTFLYALANQAQGRDKCVLGLTDPSARKCIDKDLLAFSIPYNRFKVMEEKAAGSFLSHDTWQKLLKRKADDNK